MLKKMLIKLLLLLSIIFYMNPDQLILIPNLVVSVKWGDMDNELVYFRSGKILCTERFGIDKKGNIFIEDMKLNHRKILKFNKKGEFEKHIEMNEYLNSPDRIEFDSKDNIILCSENYLMKMNQNGETIFISKNNNWQSRQWLRNFLLYDDRIIYESNDSDFIDISDGKEKKYKNNDKLNKYLSKKNIDKNFQNEKRILVIDDIILSDSIIQLKKLKKEEKKKEKLDYDPYDYSFIKKVSNFAPTLIGFDNKNNSYWRGYDIENERWIITIYDNEGRNLVWFYTVFIGDVLTSTVPPVIDYHGNVYIMQRWIKEGVKIWKYERDW